ncbi:MAG: Gfo/Idh/MocA family oxidoreductase [Elusimicrobia bacterium]|nr:Gfo/Idh/MocA family oxidoreductase [Elusimicrobiota bacterium]
MGLFSSKKPAVVEPTVSEADRVSVGVVGVGNMGRHHARLLSGLPAARLVGVADPDLARARALAAEHGTQAFARAEDFPADTRAVVVAAPTPTHFPWRSRS